MNPSARTTFLGSFGSPDDDGHQAPESQGHQRTEPQQRLAERTIRVPAFMADELARRFGAFGTSIDVGHVLHDHAQELVALGSGFAHFVVAECPPGRESALALTAIEEAVMWAVQALKVGERPQRQPQQPQANAPLILMNGAPVGGAR